ncbi:TolC family outer membrane protein [Vibrio rotiferianus]|uniref:TolC family outer membrane protein n=1 Tax=Vibrio rotiferianus TaxID=190895 RepID=UPI000B59DFA9|nr:TolC family outer membrane protein [Vibrio rotiferianus]ASI94859.1 hypothetical protein BSZ04_07560 [Vibrio rotiferianus]
MDKVIARVLCTSLLCSGQALAVTFEEVYEDAKNNSPMLNQANAKRERLHENIEQQTGALLPQVNLSASYVVSEGDSYDIERSNASIAVQQLIYDESSWQRLSLSELNAHYADVQFDDLKQSFILSVATSYFNVLRAIDKLTLTRAEKKAVREHLNHTKKRFDLGLSTATDVYDAQAEYDQMLANEITAKNRVKDRKHELWLLTNQRYGELSPLDTNKFSHGIPSSKVDELFQQAKTKNMQLLAGRISMEIHKAKIDYANSGHAPNVKLNSSYQHTNYRNGDVLDPYTDDGDTWNVGIMMNVPIYTGGQISSSVKQAQFALVESQEQFDSLIRKTEQNINKLHNDIISNSELIKAHTQSTKSAKESLKATEAGFDVGTRSIIDVLQASRRLYSSNRMLSEAQYDYIISKLSLKYQVGTISEQDVRDISKGLHIRKIKI